MTSNTSSNNVTYLTSSESPARYLYGELAAMVILISLACLLRVCSLLNLHVESEELTDEASSAEGGEQNYENQFISDKMQEKVMVIMAGDDSPTYFGRSVFSEATTTENTVTGA